MTDSKHEMKPASTCGICREWERNMSGTLAALEQERAISRKLLEALEALSGLEVKGHALIARMQFSEEGRALSAEIASAIAQAKGLAA